MVLAEAQVLTRGFALATLFAIAFSAPSPAAASPRQDFYIEQALRRYFVLPQDARGLSTGGSTDVTCRDSNCIYLNPAGLGALNKREVTISVGHEVREGEEFLIEDSIEQNQKEGYVLGAFPLGSVEGGTPSAGTLAIGFSRYQGHTDDSIHTAPDGHRRSIAYGIAVNDLLSAGYSFTFYDDQLHSDEADFHSTNRILHVWGVEANLADDLRIGTIFKLGIGQSDSEDFNFRSDGLSHVHEYSGAIAASKRFGDATVSAAYDYTAVDSDGNLDDVSELVVVGNDEDGEANNLRLGVEYAALDSFLLRAGFRYEWTHYSFSREDLRELGGLVHGPAWSAGLGYVFSEYLSNLRVDFGAEYSTIGNGSWKNLLTATLPW